MIKVMTYNLKLGGQDDFDYRRLALATRVMSAENPDVLVLQELQYAQLNRHARLHQLENELGLRSFLGMAASGQHVAVLVRKAVRVTHSDVHDSNFFNAKVEVRLDTTRGPLTVIGTHLNPFGGENRLGESQRLANSARPDQLVLLMGDLNSLDPWHSHESRVARLPPHLRSRHLLPGTETEVDTRAIATLANAGFVDLFRHVGSGTKDYTAPTAQGGGEEFCQMRVDYVLATPPLAQLAKRCQVCDRPECEIASDHYPVIAELDLELVNS